MAHEEMETVRLLEIYTHDGLGKIILIVLGVLIATVMIASVSLYMYLQEPPPQTFSVYPEWRVQAEVPLDQPYLSVPDLLQWTSDVIPKVFSYDFNFYNDQLKSSAYYFTPNGWKVFLNYLNSYANYNNVQTYKLFVDASPKGVPVLLNQGLLSGKYAWWVQMPIEITYAGYKPLPNRVLTLQVLIVRVSTLNNLSGIGIENVIMVQNAENQLLQAG